MPDFNSEKPTSRGWIYLLGILATIWFLVRVIPKPSRAQYPCMQICAPFMSGFIVQLTALAGSVFSYRQSRRYYSKARYMPAFLFLALAFTAWMVSFSVPLQIARAVTTLHTDSFYPPNEPVGTATGIFPGRVVWVWDSTSTNFNCSNTVNNNGIIDPGDDEWFMLKNNDPLVIDSMVSMGILKISGKSSLSEAWDAIFRYYNINHGFGDIGYQSGQKVFVKLNVVGAGGDAGNHFNPDLSRRDFGQSGSPLTTISNPFVVHSLLRQLVTYAGVPQEMIWIGDPMMNIFKEDYDLWQASYPNIHYLGNDLIHQGIQSLASLGRTSVYKGNGRIRYSDLGTVMPDAVIDTLYDVFDVADYIINLPAMKAHACAGISLAAKNHWGSVTRINAWHLHDGIVAKWNDMPYRTEYGMYRAQTDMLEHKMIGGRTMLVLVDGLFCGDEAQCTPQRWTSLPFGNNWASSLFVSLDPVAVESVCFDFLRTEYNGQDGKVNRPNMGAVDDYLHQAADSGLWAEGITYDPDNDGILYPSLGVHEHWNDSVQKKYSRNLGTGNGIELVTVSNVMTPAATYSAPAILFRCYPNPVSEFLEVSGEIREEVTVRVLSLRGDELFSSRYPNGLPITLDLRNLAGGVYMVCLRTGTSFHAEKVIKVDAGHRK